MEKSLHQRKASPFKDSLNYDLRASIVVFLVALPLCMGIAIASGVPDSKAAAVGIITGIVGGLVVGSISGCPLQVSGPAAGLTVIVFELVQQRGWEAVGPVVMVAGFLQLAAGAVRLGQWFRAVSPAVISGMLAGIGILIFASQFHVMVDDQPHGSGLTNLASIPDAIWKAFPLNGSSHHWAALTGLLTIIVITLWNTLARGVFRVLPAPLVAVVLATLAAAVLDLPIRRISLPESLSTAVSLPTANTLQQVLNWSTLVAGLSLAVVASAETLLCATAVDRMHTGPPSQYNRELIAQGIGNTVCGVLGVLPVTGVIVRSAANVEAGARTRASAIFHGAWLFLFVTSVPFVLEFIPTACLAAVLVFTGYKLVDWKGVKRLWNFGKSEVLIWAATLIGVVAIDLLTGVLIGIGLSAAKLLYTFSHLVIRVVDDPVQRHTVINLDGTATFVSLPKLAAALESVPVHRELHVQFDELQYIDHACLELLMNWEKQFQSTGSSLTIDWASLEARFHRPPIRHRNLEPSDTAVPIPSRDSQAPEMEMRNRDATADSR